MDGTLFNWSDRLNTILRSMDPAFPIVSEGQRQDFDYFWVPGADKAIIKAAMDDPQLYEDLPPIEASVNAYLEMVDAGWDVFTCTSPTWTNPGCVAGKLASIDQHLGPRAADRMIVTKDKTVVRGTVLIDDKPVITGAHTPSWTHIVFDQDYNRYVNADFRMTDPSRWRELLAPFSRATPVLAAH